MARSGAVWGIDIGQCALKALRCRAHDKDNTIEAVAFDYIEYPKILSQPDAEPEELIADALKQFLSRNSVRGDKVAISVAGQSGLARFIKLPPVEAKKIPDIVRYEARQQIPFDLNDVIWDYQRMGGGAEEEGFALETEVGLFAIKRDAVFRALAPFQNAGIGLDFVQLTPLALYNFVLFDQLTDLPAAEDYDPEMPPESVVILSLGTDATDLVVTNGFRVWQRSVPIGGNHFTKALTQELKLTFAKAEHLKRNAASAQDPKAVFQAMRPVFSDLLTELQRSLGYFSNIDRSAKIGHIVALGNTMKLPGLRRYLAQNLGYDVIRLDEFRGLAGSEVLAAPAFKDNAVSFGVCYGLAVQGLGESGLRTNLLPREIVHDRLVREKKPWAVAAAAVILLGCTINFATAAFGLRAVAVTDDPRDPWKVAQGMASATQTEASGYKTAEDDAKKACEEIDNIGGHLVQNIEGRVLWLELMYALSHCLPVDPVDPAAAAPAKDLDLTEHNRLYITNIESRHLDAEQVKIWYEKVVQGGQPGDAAADAGAGNDSVANAGAEEEPEDGARWIVMLTGYHYHNRGDQRSVGARFVREQLVDKLRNRVIDLPTGKGDETVRVDMKALGIDNIVLYDPQRTFDDEVEMPGSGQVIAAGDGGAEVVGGKRREKIERFNFLVHFSWRPTTASKRLAEAEEARKKAQEEEAAQAADQYVE